MSMVDREVATIHQDQGTATCLLDHNDPVTAKQKNCLDGVQAHHQLRKMLCHIVQVLVIECLRLTALVQM